MASDVNEGGRPSRAATSFTVTIGVGFWRAFFKWASGILLVGVTGALLLSVNVFQLTSRGPAAETLQRALASLTEIDALLLEGEADLRALAEQSPDEEIELEHYPIEAGLSAEELQGLSTTGLRELILSRSADKFYAEGPSSFQEGGTDSSDISLLSAPGAVRYTVGLLTKDTHDLARTLTAALVGAALLLTLLLVLLSRGYGRLTGLGIVLVAAALPYLLIAVSVRFVLKLASEGESDYLAAQLYDLGKDVAWLPIHTGIAFVLLGVVFATLGLVFGWLHGRRDEGPAVALGEEVAR